MVSTVICQKPAVDYFSLTTQRPQNIKTSSPLASTVWDYSDPVAVNSSNSDSCDSNLTSPTSPESIHYPDTYILPKPELSKDAEIKSEEAFDFGTFEDWMRWDDLDAGFSPTATSFFPEVKTESMSPGMSRLELQRGPISKSSFDSRALAEESVVFIEDPVSGPLFQTPDLMEMASSPVNQGSEPEGLYSTPLAWSTPIPGRAQSQNGDMLSPQEAEELRNIAMPPSTQAPPERKHYPTSPESSSASPEPSHKKRKSSLEDDYSDFEQESSPVTNGNGGRHPPVKKTAHNMIEKRYRTNLNDKIAALRASVPSLRVMTKKNSRGEELHEDLQGLTPAHKLNKATVLSKATEYIAHLEKRNKYLTKENAGLKSRVDAFEILVMARQPSQQQERQQQRNSMAQQGGGRNYRLDGMMS